MEVQASSILVEYYKSLQADSTTPYPEELDGLLSSGVDFEVRNLFKYIVENSGNARPFIMDVSEQEIINLLRSEDDTVAVSAIISLMDLRVPSLGLRARV